MNKRQTQADRILDLLEITTHWPEDSIHGWISLPILMRMGIASHTRRVSDLRARGLDVRCKKETVDGQVRSKYRLVK